MMYFDQARSYLVRVVSFLKKKDTYQFILVFKKDEGQYDGVYPVEYADLLSFGEKKSV